MKSLLLMAMVVLAGLTANFSLAQTEVYQGSIGIGPDTWVIQPAVEVKSLGSHGWVVGGGIRLNMPNDNEYELANVAQQVSRGDRDFHVEMGYWLLSAGLLFQQEVESPGRMFSLRGHKARLTMLLAQDKSVLSVIPIRADFQAGMIQPMVNEYVFIGYAGMDFPLFIQGVELRKEDKEQAKLDFQRAVYLSQLLMVGPHVIYDQESFGIGAHVGSFFWDLGLKLGASYMIAPGDDENIRLFLAVNTNF